MSVRFDMETIRLITIFENITGAPVKDCIVTKDTIYFIIEEGKIGIAIGKNGNSVKNAEKMLDKNIKIFEFSKDLSKFVKKLIHQANMIKIREEDGEVTVEVRVDKNNKGFVIGRDGKNLKLFKEFLRRNYNVSDLVIK